MDYMASSRIDVEKDTPNIAKRVFSDRRPPSYETGAPPQFPMLDEFVETYLPNKLPDNWHHVLFYDILMNKVIYDKESKKFIINYDQQKYGGYAWRQDVVNRYIMLMAPRFHAKSQCLTMNYPLWEIYRNPNVRVLIVSANEEIAKSFVRQIKMQLESNDKLIEDWGSLKPKNPDKWGEQSIIVERETTEKDPTLSAVGTGGKMISKRADVIILDDIIDLEIARTKTQREKTFEWYENVLLPILEEDGRIIVTGTAWYKDDIYDRIMRESDFDIKLKLKALTYLARHTDPAIQIGKLPYMAHNWPQALKLDDIFDDEVISRYHLSTKTQHGTLWEEKWSFEKLMKRKDKTNMTNASFSRQFLNEPVSEQDQLFKKRFVDRAFEKGRGKALVPDWDNSNPKKHGVNYAYGQLIVATGVDLAISKKKRSDNSAIATWGLTASRDVVPLALDWGKWSPDEVKQRVIETYHNYKPVKVRVENVGFQEIIRQDLNEEIPVEGFYTTASKKFNEQTGLSYVAMLFEQERVLLPANKMGDYSDSYSRVTEFARQIMTYSYSDHAGDLLMASWFAIDALRSFDKKFRDNRGYFDSAALVEQNKKVSAPHKIVLLGWKPQPVFKFSHRSLVHIFRPVIHPDVDNARPFFDNKEKFMVFATREIGDEGRSIAYILEKSTSEVVGKIEGRSISVTMYAQLLEKTGMFFNNAQIVVDKNEEGAPVLIELQRRNYPHVLCMQPDETGMPTAKEGFKITKNTLPPAMDHFKMGVEGGHIEVKDDAVIKEMGELIRVEGDKLEMSFGSGQRMKTLATAIWILDTYETGSKKLYNKSKDSIVNKAPKIPYRIFAQNNGSIYRRPKKTRN